MLKATTLSAIVVAMLVVMGLPELRYEVAHPSQVERAYELFKQARLPKCPAFFFYDEKAKIITIQGKKKCLAPIEQKIDKAIH